MENLYYVFANEQIAIDAEAYICKVAGGPIVGRNAETGKLAPDKQKTIRWAVPKQRNDGKWVFPYVGDARVAEYSEEVAETFDENYPHTKEEYAENWFEEIEEPKE